jgi:hypothetical protein
MASQVLVLICYQSPYSKSRGKVNFGDFGFHPCLMVTTACTLPKPARFSDAIAVRHMLFTVRCYFQVVAFGFCAPVAMVSYKTYEHLLGMSHQCAKLIHAFLQTAALVLQRLNPLKTDSKDLCALFIVL